MCYRFDSYKLYISLNVFALMDMNEYKNHILNKSNYCREDIHISLDLFWLRMKMMPWSPGLGT